MKAQIMLREGPFDMHLITYEAIGKFPDQLRVAHRSEESSVEAEVYSRTEISDMPVSLMKFGAYTYVGNKRCARSLVDVWV